MRYPIAAALALLAAGAARAGEGEPQLRSVPLTRPELKKALEALKEATPRVPPPELTEEERAKLSDRTPTPEARIRARYLPPEYTGSAGGGGGGFPREADPNMTLDGTFKTMLFWIVSRVNNCHY
jgi:hypothetical protein